MHQMLIINPRFDLKIEYLMEVLELQSSKCEGISHYAFVELNMENDVKYRLTIVEFESSPRDNSAIITTHLPDKVNPLSSRFLVQRRARKFNVLSSSTCQQPRVSGHPLTVDDTLLARKPLLISLWILRINYIKAW